MPFRSDKQRKGFFAKQGNTRSDVTPKFFIVSSNRGKTVIETTASKKTLKRTAGATIKLKRLSKSRATTLIKLGRSRGFRALPIRRVGRGRLKQIVIKKRKGK